MASNPTPEGSDLLRALADRIADGCHTYEVVIGIKQNTEAAIRAAIAALTAAEMAVGLKKQALAAATAAQQAADDAGSLVLTNCRLRLAQKLGQRWSADWEPTGFPGRSTGVPRLEDERFSLLASLKAYFTEVPANESADMGATAALCDAAWVASSDARQASANAETAMTNAFDARSAAIDALRKRVRGLISELEGLIPPDDSRWSGFGLNIPANPTRPDPVASVAASTLGGGRFQVSWPYSARSVRFRVETKIEGVDADFTSNANAKDLEVILKGFTAGQVVNIRVIAINDAGEAAPSPVTTVTAV